MGATYGRPADRDTGGDTGRGSDAGTGTERGRVFAVVTALLAGTGTLIAGVWALGWPASFADAVEFPAHEHFPHDIGAFQLGLGVTLFLACVWYDALATALAGFLVANGVHTVNHALDLHHGGQSWHIAALAAVTAVLAAALATRLRGVGWSFHFRVTAGKRGSQGTP